MNVPVHCLINNLITVTEMHWFIMAALDHAVHWKVNTGRPKREDLTIYHIFGAEDLVD